MSKKKLKSFDLTTKQGREKAVNFLKKGGMSISTALIISAIAKRVADSAILAESSSLLPASILIGDPIIGGLTLTMLLWTIVVKRNQLEIVKKLLKLSKEQGFKKVEIEIKKSRGLGLKTRIVAGFPVELFALSGNTLRVKAKLA